MCASKGSIILPIKDAAVHSFVTTWGGSAGIYFTYMDMSVGGDAFKMYNVMFTCSEG